jgi:F-type H+-transporting ATPase subunit epsilon
VETHSGKHLTCVVVTPERAILDEPAEFVALPMIDGELGVLPGRAPLIGRLGAGELRLRQRGTTRRLFIDGGFAQVRSDTVTILTSRALAADEINPQTAEQDLTTARAAIPKTPEEREARTKAEQRARAMLRVARKTGATGGHH